MKVKKTIPVLLSLSLCVQAPMAVNAAGASVQVDETQTLSEAAKVKNGPYYEKGKWYYYKNGVKQKNTWKTIKRSGKYYKYYFGKDGAAYVGKKVNGEKVYKVARINGSYYGFDLSGRMLKGTYVINGKFYVFSSKDGKMNRTVSAKIRNACKYGKSTATLKKLLTNIGQKPTRTVTADGCYGDGKDKLYYYKNFILSAHQNTDGTEIFFSVMTR